METAQAHQETDQVFDRIFYPGAVAVIGVSSQGGGFGSGILDSLSAIGFSGDLYGVNPKGGEYKGRKLYRSIAEIPNAIDFAIIAVTAPQVPEILEQCRGKGVAGVEILSSGFSEADTFEGRELEQEIRRIAARGIRVVGPNCFGIYCPESGLTLLPGPDLSRVSGPVAFLSQSGGMSIDFAHIGNWMGVKFSKVVSFGNGADLRETELLEYLGRDPETRVIAMYMEGVEDGREFLRILRKVASTKPVIINKGGLSEAGSRMVASHTGSMGGSRIIWESALRQAGAIQVADLWELAQACLAFSLLPIREYGGVSVAGGGGALGVSAGDLAERYGLVLPAFDGDMSEKLLEVLPRPGSSAKNPIDAANPFVGPDAFRHVFSHAGIDPRIDIQVLIQLLHHYKPVAMSLGLDSIHQIAPYTQLAQAMHDARDATGKPAILVMPDFKQGRESLDIEALIRDARQAFLEKDIPVFSDLGDALRAIHHVTTYASRMKSRMES
ncbi:MAG TPA: CoA-binding protein [Deltaproteobacteria bacterium]|mgnify:CR=1 FL=1|nr:CoA-binding protein [Deltaproteobacteria bacterium]HPR55916.1 CoA-binding protein [Deltaproteobacteria bacterium]HXK47805.1 CoA-binding protein [Deltaproteobacteria bacterium]